MRVTRRWHGFGKYGGIAALCAVAPLCTPAGMLLGQGLAIVPVPGGAAWARSGAAAGVALLYLPLALFFSLLSAAGLQLLRAWQEKDRAKRRRRGAWSLLTLALLFAGAAALPSAGEWSQARRREGLLRASERGRSVIAAIEAYQARHGRPPASLDDLVPGFLPRGVPGTGMLAYPRFRYQVADGRSPTLTWELSVNMTRGFVNFDRLLYWPERTYPDRFYGGTAEPIGEWAYVHE